MSTKCLTEAAEKLLLSLLCLGIFFYLCPHGSFPGGARRLREFVNMWYL